MGRPHLTWMDTAMYDMGSLGRTLQIDLPRDWANLALYRDMWRGVVSRFEQCFILFSSFPLLLASVVGGLGFEFCVFVAGWRHALRSEWHFIIIVLSPPTRAHPTRTQLAAVQSRPQHSPTQPRNPEARKRQVNGSGQQM